MKVYKRKESNPMKWVLAAALFVGVMTFTMGEVYGYPTTMNHQKPGYQSNDDGDHSFDSIDQSKRGGGKHGGGGRDGGDGGRDGGYNGGGGHDGGDGGHDGGYNGGGGHDGGDGGGRDGGDHNGGGSNGGGCDGGGSHDNPKPSAVPEPGTMMLMATGLGSLYFMRKTRKAE